VTEDSKPSFWVTVPGMLAAVAAVITALTGVVVAANSGGGGGGEVASDVTRSSAGPADANSASSGVTSSSATGSSVSSSRSAAGGEGDVLAGTWTGQARWRSEAPFRVRLVITAPCWVTEPCGTLYVSSDPCWGKVSLLGVRRGVFELSVDRFTGRSAPSCRPGYGEFFELLDDGTLRYTTDYHVRGVLHRAG
jgi:hypothetical protein